MKEYINPDGLMSAIGYTHVVTTGPGKTIYISGQVPVNQKAEIQGVGDFKTQVEQTFKNLETALKGAGVTFNDVVKLNIFVVDYTPEYLPILREVRSKYLNQANPPAITLAGAAALYHPDVKIEVEVVAHQEEK